MFNLLTHTFHSLMEQLHLCVATSSVHYFFAKAPIYFAFFAPHLQQNVNLAVTGLVDKRSLVMLEVIPLKVVNVGEQLAETT